MKRLTNAVTACLLGGLAGLHCGRLGAAEILRADNAEPLNTGGAWAGGVAPGAADIAVWHNAVSANLSAFLGADLSWAGLRITDPAGPVSIEGGNLLTLGASGIDLGAATRDLTLNAPVAVSVSQTWSLAADRTLTVNEVLSGPAGSTLTKSGPGVLDLNGTANGTFAGPVAVDAGVLRLRGANNNNGSSAGVGVITNNPGATIRFAAGVIVGNPAAFNGASVVDANSFSALITGAWSGSGTVLLTNLAAGQTFTAGGNGLGGGSMNAFAGKVVLADDAAGFFRFNNGGGNPNVGNVSFELDMGQGTATFLSRNATTIKLGAFWGGPGTFLSGPGSANGTAHYSIGGKNLDTTFAGTIQDNPSNPARIAGLTKVGTGVFTLTGTNTHTGAINVHAGTLRIGDGFSNGTLGSGAVVNNATLAFDGPEPMSVFNAISGAGTLVQRGAGTLTLEGAVSGAGGILVESGTLAFGGGATVATAIEVAAGAVLDLSAQPGFNLGQGLSGRGLVLGSVSAGSGSTINAAGPGVGGVMAFGDGLTLAGGLLRFDLSDDLSGTVKSNDLVLVTGDLTVAAPSAVAVNPLNGFLPEGVYPLVRYTGDLVGELSALSLSGATGVLTNRVTQKEIALIVFPAARPPASLVWQGDGVANVWDSAGASNWLNGAEADAFLPQDHVRFGAAGSTTPAVTLPALLTPASVVVDSTTDYILEGAGGLTGTTGLTKTNSGRLTLLTVNDHTGPTVVGGGVLSVQGLSGGGVAGPLGSAGVDPTNLVFFGATLEITGAQPSSTDRGATLAEGGLNVDVVTEGVTVTQSGLLTGPGGLTKSGAGTLRIEAANDFTGGVVLSNGVLRLGSQAANSSGAFGGLGATNNPVVFRGGVLQLFGHDESQGANYNTLHNPLVVPEGETGTLRLFARGPANSGDNSGLASSLTGGGTLNLVVNYVRDNLDGDWSAFTGLINVTAKSGVSDEMRINNAFGYANASVFLNDGVILNRVTAAGATVDIGELAGTALAIVGPGNQSAVNPTWRVGWKNTSATFAGSILDDGVTTVIKVGSGTWTLTGQNSHTGSTIVSNGVLALAEAGSLASTNIQIDAGAFLDVSALPGGNLVLGLDQALSGAGALRGGLDASGGGIVSPGGGGGLGTLTVTNAVSLGGRTVMELDRSAAPNSDRLAAPTISLGGVLELHVLGGLLRVGDTFDLFDGALTDAGVTVQAPEGYAFDTTQLAVNGTVSVTGAPTLPAIGTIRVGSGNTVEVSGDGGPAGGTFQVLTSDDIAAPLSEWTPVGTGTFGNDGAFGFTNAVNGQLGQEFFLIRQE